MAADDAIGLYSNSSNFPRGRDVATAQTATAASKTLRSIGTVAVEGVPGVALQQKTYQMKDESVMSALVVVRGAESQHSARNGPRKVGFAVGLLSNRHPLFGAVIAPKHTKTSPKPQENVPKNR